MSLLKKLSQKIKSVISIGSSYQSDDDVRYTWFPGCLSNSTSNPGPIGLTEPPGVQGWQGIGLYPPGVQGATGCQGSMGRQGGLGPFFPAHLQNMCRATECDHCREGICTKEVVELDSVGMCTGASIAIDFKRSYGEKKNE